MALHKKSTTQDNWPNNQLTTQFIEKKLNDPKTITHHVERIA